jgi:hypothetical protein
MLALEFLDSRVELGSNECARNHWGEMMEGNDETTISNIYSTKQSLEIIHKELNSIYSPLQDYIVLRVDRIAECPDISALSVSDLRTMVIDGTSLHLTISLSPGLLLSLN